MIIPEHKIVFIGVTKSASTSINNYLASRFGDMPVGDSWTTHENIKEDYRIGSNSNQHISAKEHIKYIKNKLGEDPNDWYFFSIKRDPMDRLYSEYKYMCQQRPKLYNKSFEDCISDRTLWDYNYPWHGVSYYNMVRHAPNLKEFSMSQINLIPDWIDSVCGNNSDVKIRTSNTTDKSSIPEISKSSFDIILSYWWQDFPEVKIDDKWIPISPKIENFVKTNYAYNTNVVPQ